VKALRRGGKPLNHRQLAHRKLCDCLAAQRRGGVRFTSCPGHPKLHRGENWLDLDRRRRNARLNRIHSSYLVKHLRRGGFKLGRENLMGSHLRHDLRHDWQRLDRDWCRLDRDWRCLGGDW